MEVTFLRHGIAVDRTDPQSPPDPDRPLTLEGKNRTEAAGRGLKAIGIKPAAIFTSPYLRCTQTARLVANELAFPRKSILTLDALRPDADPHTLWQELTRYGHPSVLCIGHGGAIEPIAGLALGLPTHTPETPDIPDLAFRTLRLKKAGALQLDVMLSPELRASLNWHLSPKLLRQLGRS
jgi:phosphohistidine phosphatase SixA